MIYFGRVRVREDRLSDLTYVAPLTVDQFEEEEKGKDDMGSTDLDWS